MDAFAALHRHIKRAGVDLSNRPGWFIARTSPRAMVRALPRSSGEGGCSAIERGDGRVAVELPCRDRQDASVARHVDVDAVCGPVQLRQFAPRGGVTLRCGCSLHFAQLYASSSVHHKKQNYSANDSYLRL